LILSAVVAETEQRKFIITEIKKRDTLHGIHGIYRQHWRQFAMSVIVKSTESQLDLSDVSQVALAEMANSAAESVERNLQSAVQHAITAGRALIAAKGQCSHGEWLPWLKANWRFSERLSRQYIELANWQSSADLSSASSIAEALRMIADSKPKIQIEEKVPLFQYEDVDAVSTPDGFECVECGQTLDAPAKHCFECGDHYAGNVCECQTAISYEEENVVDAVVEHTPEEFDIEHEKLEEDVEITTVTRKPQPKNWLTIEEWESVVVDDLEFESDKTFNKQDNTSIEWAQWSWNPITGCKHDCPYCYARDIANRFYPQQFEPSIYPCRFACPENTKVPANAESDASFKNVFTGSMADIFGRWVPTEWIDLVLERVELSPQWNFLFLTKFPQRVHEFKDLPSNAWMGTTVDCQARVSNAEKAFSKMGGGTKWLSIEPMLTPLKFTKLKLFDWVVIGGASKSSATPEWVPPMDWIADIHKQARDAGCAIYHKDNLKLPDELRVKEFPWVDREVKALPDSMKYLGIK
jgi:protein gp37